MSRRILWLAAALAALVACEKAAEEAVVPAPAPEAEMPGIVKNLFDQVVPAPGGPVTISAGFAETRAHIEMNDEGTFARSVWKAGDRFYMYGKTANGAQIAEFTASADGASADFTTSGGITVDAPYYALFPAGSRKFGKYGDALLFGANIPTEQEALPGGIKDGYTVAFTTTPSLTEFLHFQSMVSLVRFRMSGNIVPEVSSVTIKGSSAVAGDIIISASSDGSASLANGISFNGDNQSSTVTLSGSFVAGKDYFIVLRPGTQERFQMIFADGAGHSTTKVATAFTFPVGRISDFGTIDLGDAFTDDNVVYDPIPYMTATAGAPKPVTIAVIGDGFTKEQMDDYVLLAKSGVDALMNTEPYKSYASYFNVWILRAASRESGASVTDGSGNVTTPVDTYFSSKWGSDSYNDMAASADEVFAFVSENCPDVKDGTHAISEVPVLMIINDSRYGGICHSYSNGMGYGMVPYSYDGGQIGWSYPNVTPSTNDPVSADAQQSSYHWTTSEEYNELGTNHGDWRNTLVHEFGGHCFGRLGDEYWPSNAITASNSAIGGHTWSVPFSLNLTADPTNLPWQADIMDYPLESLVAKDPHYGRIGVFQGGGTCLFGRWRSEMISCMIDNRFYFSAWQRMLIVKRIMSLSGSEFNAASFWEKDVTTDPVRDAASSPVMGGDSQGPVRMMPPLPPPVLHEE